MCNNLKYSCFFSRSLLSIPSGGSSSTEPVSLLSPTLVSRCSTRRVQRGAIHKFRTLFKVLLARLFLSVPNCSYERINHLRFLSSISPSACSRFPDVTFLSRGRMAGPSRHWKASSGVSQQSARVSGAAASPQRAATACVSVCALFFFGLISIS